MNKRFLIILIIIIALVGGFLLIPSSDSTSTSSHPTIKKTAGTTSHYEGDMSSKVTLTEYGDYECPICGAYYPTMQEVLAKYKDTVQFQFRNLPLTSIHANAFAGARAAEAADLQGKFWQMHDLLYQEQDTSGESGWVASSDPLDDYFVGFAKQLGLKTSEFKTDFASTKVNTRINADLSSFVGDKATPTFFINGKYYANSNFTDSSGEPALDSFSSVLDKVLKSTNK